MSYDHGDGARLRASVGQQRPRKEDERLVRGEGIYFDDRDGGRTAGYVELVRSPLRARAHHADRRLRGRPRSTASTGR